MRAPVLGAARDLRNAARGMFADLRRVAMNPA
jgi:hypothetical protein